MRGGTRRGMRPRRSRDRGGRGPMRRATARRRSRPSTAAGSDGRRCSRGSRGDREDQEPDEQHRQGVASLRMRGGVCRPRGLQNEHRGLQHREPDHAADDDGAEATKGGWRRRLAARCRPQRPIAGGHQETGSKGFGSAAASCAASPRPSPSAPRAPRSTARSAPPDTPRARERGRRPARARRRRRRARGSTRRGRGEAPRQWLREAGEPARRAARDELVERLAVLDPHRTRVT